MSSSKNNAKFITLLAGTACVLLCVGIGVRHSRHGHPDPGKASVYKTLVNGQQMELRSSLPYHEVRIPFTLQGGVLYVQATLAGRSLQCVVDTGANYPDWNSSIQLKGIYGKEVYSSIDGDGTEVIKKPITLPNIQLGDLTVKDPFTYTISAPDKAKRPLHDFAPILGNSIFNGLILTIDFANKMLLVRDPTYDFTKQPKLPGAVENNLSFYPSGENDVPTLLGVEGKLNEKSVNWKIDTGSAYPAIVSHSIVQKWHLDTYDGPEMLGSFNRSRAATFTASQEVTLAGDTIRTQLFVEMHNQDEQQTLMGCPLLSRYRITIDYPRRKILWEPTRIVPPQKEVIQLKNGGKILREGEKSTYYPPNGAPPFLLSEDSKN